jgi:MFS family permease
LTADAIQDGGFEERQPGVGAGRAAAVCLGQILNLAGYSAVPALLPRFISAWSLSNTEAGWLSGTFFLGYMTAVLPLVSLTDRWPARRIYLASATLNLLYYLGFAISGGLAAGLGLQFLGGVALAGMYMPGLRAITGAAQGFARARIAAWYTSSFTVGAALSFQLAGHAAELWGWQGAYSTAASCAGGGALIAALALPRSATRRTVDAAGLRALPAVFRNRQVMAFVIAYAATIWSSVGLRNWVVLFFSSAAAPATPAGAAGWVTLGAATVINLLGVPAALCGNELALRFGLRRIAATIFILAALTAGLFGLAAHLPYRAAIAMALVAAFIVQGNFANLTTGLLAAAEPARAGVTMALYSFIGFAGSFLGPLVFGATLDRFGGAASAVAWLLAFGSCGVAAIVGALMLLLLARDSSGERVVVRRVGKASG